jgi:anti-sigma B factor antagonist
MNNGTATTLSVCVRDHAACVRIAGRANFASSVDFKRLVLQLQQDGCDEIILDLRECRLMDSTFLGVLAGLGARADESRARGRACVVELFRPSDRVTELLDNLGVLQLFTIIQEAAAFDSFEPVKEGDASKTELNRTCYEAHERLMQTSPENERRFKDATEFFKKNLTDPDRTKDKGKGEA